MKKQNHSKNNFLTKKFLNKINLIPLVQNAHFFLVNRSLSENVAQIGTPKS